MDPITFISNPLIWVECLERYTITATAGPNFSYALKLRQSSNPRQHDLSHMRYVSMAAEMIYPATVDAICKGDQEKRYGAAEACIWISTKDCIFDDEGIAATGNTELSRQYDMDIVIANHNSLEPATDEVTGEVFVHSSGLAKEYWNNPGASFQNKIVVRDGKWYGTGGFGYIKSGSLFVTGRLKDVIIVNGNNIYGNRKL